MKTRRSFLADTGMGFTGLALGAMLHEDGIAKEPAGVTGKPHFPPRAKNVIWLFMLGGTSHMESFDPKPALNKHAGKTLQETPYGKEILGSPFYRKNVRDFGGFPRALLPKVFPLQIGYRRRGQAGIEISDWWPHLATCADDLAVVRSIWTTDNDHAAQLQFHTGRHIFDGFFSVDRIVGSLWAGHPEQQLAEVCRAGQRSARVLWRQRGAQWQLPGTGT